MIINSVQFGISIEFERIAFWQRSDDGIWNLLEAIDIKDLELEAVHSAFIEGAKHWRERGQTIAVWVPEALVSEGEIAQNTDLKNVKILKSAGEDKEFAIAQEDFQASINLAQELDFEAICFGFAPIKEREAHPKLFEIESAQREPISPLPQRKIRPENDTELGEEARIARFSTLKSEQMRETRMVAIAVLSFAALLILGALGYWAYHWVSGLGSEAFEEVETTENGIDDTDERPDLPEEVVEEGAENGDGEQVQQGNQIHIFLLPKYDKSLPERPLDHGEVVESLQAQTPFVLNEAPGFLIIARPDTHDQDVAEIAAREPSDISPEQNLTFLNDPSTTTSSQSVPQPDGGMILLGIIGRASQPDALIRTPSGDILHLAKGDEVAGWKIIAISKTEVILTKGKDKISLFVPEG